MRSLGVPKMAIASSETKDYHLACAWHPLKVHTGRPMILGFGISMKKSWHYVLGSTKQHNYNTWASATIPYSPSTGKSSRSQTESAGEDRPLCSGRDVWHRHGSVHPNTEMAKNPCHLKNLSSKQKTRTMTMSTTSTMSLVPFLECYSGKISVKKGLQVTATTHPADKNAGWLDPHVRRDVVLKEFLF